MILIIGDCEFDIPIELSSHIDIIKERYDNILLLEDDYDGDGSKTVNKNILDLTLCFLIEYILYCYKTYNVIICVPNIIPLHDGMSIDLSWRKSVGRMLINIRESSACLYGVVDKNTFEIQGRFPLNCITEYLAVWMKSYLINN